MSEQFQLSCESTVDFPYSYAEERNLSVIFYTYMVDDKEYIDDMGRDPEALPKFYNFLKQGKLPKTSQINLYAYCEYFKKLLEKGDVLHIVFGSGMTTSIQNAREAAEMMKEQFPDRKLIVFDSTCSSSGYGMIVDTAADMRDAGASMEEIEKWLTDNCHKIRHQFFSTDLQHFRRGGRISGTAATVGAVLNICPLMRLNYDGFIIAYSKVRGKKNAIRALVDNMTEHAAGGRDYSGKCFISNANALSDAEMLRDILEETFPNIKGNIRIFDIGTIIASHTGPGTVALFYFGDDRPE